MNIRFTEKVYSQAVCSCATAAIVFPLSMYIGSSVFLAVIEIIVISSLLLMKVYKRKLLMPPEESSDAIQIPVSVAQGYDRIRTTHKEYNAKIAMQKYAEVENYVRFILSPYLEELDITTVCDDILAWISNEEAVLKSVCTRGRLASIDLRHFAWNVGERFAWSGEKRALFIKLVFPIEMKDIDVVSIRRNLRQYRKCIIELDTPKPGDYRFTFLQTAQKKS